MSEGSVSVQLARVVLAAVRESGTDRGRFADRPDLAPEVLADDLCRVSTPTMAALWEQLTLTGHGSAIGAAVARACPAGSLGVWDYLFAAGENLLETGERAIAYVPVVGDPAAERATLVRDGRHCVLRHASGEAVPDVVEAVEVFAVALYLRRMREAARRSLVPVRVAFRHRAPRDPSPLYEAFGTRNIEFGSPEASLTFLDGDLLSPLPPSQPGLGAILARHAEMMLVAAKPVVQWIDAFRIALASAAEDDTASLSAVARRLAISLRTRQRRLDENATTWRRELDRLRGQTELRLLQGTSLPVGSVAGRVGYSDTRAYRRAVQRRHGTVPSLLRET